MNLTGRTLGRYQVLESLGEGAMGAVYKARDRDLERFVALKILPSFHSEDAAARFEREARAISALNHPHIATIHALEKADGLRFLVLEYVSGGTLTDKLNQARERNEPLPPADVIEAVLEIAEGLAHAHRKGVVHRDIKSDNILVAEDGSLKVADFGVAKLELDAALTEEGGVLGTMAYMAPEQLLGEETDHRTDIFSFGVLAHEIACGERPFQSPHLTALQYEILNSEPPPLSAYRNDLPPRLEELILRALAKRPADRPQSMTEICDILAELHRELTAASGSGAGAERPPRIKPLEIGETVGRYRLLSKIGEGGMGVVYRALDLNLDRQVALKVLKAEAVAKPERRRRFVQEAKAASALNHPNIVTVHEIDERDGVCYIAMEYVAGETLDRRPGIGPASLRESIELAIQVADALAAAHAAGVVHRDLKPANVIVDANGRAKLLDFGLAKLTDKGWSGSSGDSDRPETEEGVILGTVAYMSPEQAEGRSVDGRLDVHQVRRHQQRAGRTGRNPPRRYLHPREPGLNVGRPPPGPAQVRPPAADRESRSPLMHSPRTGRRGQAMVFILMMSTVMFILAGLAVDFVWAYVIRARLVTSVDAAALAAVRALGRGDANISRVVTLVFESNFPPEYMLAKAVDFTPPVISSPEPGIRNVTLHGSATAPTFFMRILGFESIDVSALATASRRDVNLMLVLDRSGSLHETRANAWVSVQEAASFFVDQFDDSRDQVGLVSFGSGANVDVPLGTGFKTPVLNAINAQIVAFGAGTNSPHGMWLAYAELLRLQDANPLNVIVFFTDGQPSAYTGVFNVRTTPNSSNNSVPYCDTSPKEAVIGTLQSTTTAAFYDILGFWNPHAAGPPVTVRYQSGQDYDYFIVDGCNSPNGSFLHNGSAVELLFDAGTCLPMTWTPTWAGVTRTFSMVTGPYSVDQCSSLLKETASSSQLFRGDQVHNAAKNLTVNIAEAARQDSSLGQVRVYSVGLGGWGYPADGAFLQIVANDPQSTQFSTSEPSGVYVYAPSQLQLRAAFNTVASEIFRLIR